MPMRGPTGSALPEISQLIAEPASPERPAVFYEAHGIILVNRNPHGLSARRAPAAPALPAARSCRPQ